MGGLRPHERVHQENGSEAQEAACWCVLAPAPERPCAAAPCTDPFRPHKLLVPQGCLPLQTLLGHKDANRCTLKPFRAGRATSLAAAGPPIGVILAAGEWKSSAFLRYCQADEVSVSAVLEVVCAEDED